MGHGNQWDPAEDLALTRAWIEVSEDPLIGTAQRSGDFWRRVVDAFGHLYKGEGNRTERALQGRWSTLMSSCMKFGGCYDQVHSHIGSGMSDEDVLRCAHETYSVDDKKGAHFKFVECLNVLKTVPKFKQMSTSTQSKKGSDLSDSSSPMESLSRMPSNVGSGSDSMQRTPFDNEERPVGHKRAKQDARSGKLLEVLATKLKAQTKFQETQTKLQEAQTRLQEKRQRTFEMTCGAILFSVKDDQIPKNCKHFFNTARGKFLQDLHAGTIPTPVSGEAGGDDEGGYSADSDEDVDKVPPPHSPPTRITNFEQTQDIYRAPPPPSPPTRTTNFEHTSSGHVGAQIEGSALGGYNTNFEQTPSGRVGAQIEGSSLGGYNEPYYPNLDFGLGFAQ